MVVVTKIHILGAYGDGVETRLLWEICLGCFNHIHVSVEFKVDFFFFNTVYSKLI